MWIIQAYAYKSNGHRPRVHVRLARPCRTPRPLAPGCRLPRVAVAVRAVIPSFYHTKTYKCFSFILGRPVGPCRISTRRHVNQRPGGAPSRGYARAHLFAAAFGPAAAGVPVRPAPHTHKSIVRQGRAAEAAAAAPPPSSRGCPRAEAGQWMRGLRNPLGQAVSQPSCASGHLVPCTMRLRGGPQAHTSRPTPQGPHSKGKSACRVPAEPPRPLACAHAQTSADPQVKGSSVAAGAAA